MTPAQIVDMIYPVGSIYMSANPANPGTIYTGTTWVAIQGKFLFGADATHAAGSTGGSATINLQHTHTTGDHTLTSAESGQQALTITGGEHSHYVYMMHSQSGSSYTGTIPAESNYLVWNTAVKWTTSSMSNRNVTEPLNVSQTTHTHEIAASDAQAAHSHGDTGTAGSASQDIMPPYLAVYIWQRTA